MTVQLPRAPIIASGVTGDRAYAVIDDETGKVVSVKRPKRWGRMFDLTASIADGVVRMAFPDGLALPIDDPSLSARLSEFLGRSVSVASTPPPNASFEEVWAGDLKAGVARLRRHTHRHRRQ